MTTTEIAATAEIEVSVDVPDDQNPEEYLEAFLEDYINSSDVDNVKSVTTE